MQLAHDGLGIIGERSTPQLGEIEAEDVAGGDLREERLGRGNGDLGPGVGVEDGVGLARDGRAVRVADAQGEGAELASVLDGHERVHGLAGLADRDDEAALVDDGVGIAELVREGHLDRDAGPVLDGVLGDHPGVGRGATGDDRDPIDVLELLLVDPQFVEDELAVLRRAPEQGVTDRVGLVEDLLLHEGVVATLLRSSGVPRDLVGRALGGCTIEGDDLVAVGGDRDDLVLAELERVPGVADERGHVGAEEVLTIA